MLLEFIAAIALAVGVAGIVVAVNRLLGGALPRFIIPVSAGLAMIGFAIWSEYSWYERTRGQLPDDIAVITTHSESSPLRPWTYASPYVSRFAAIDLASQRRNDAAPGQVMADLLLFGRYAPTSKIPVLVDCAEGRRADIVDGASFDADGRVVDAQWRALPPEDPMIRTLCPTG